MESSKDKRTKALLQPQVSLKQYVVYMKEDANCPTYRCSAGEKNPTKQKDKNKQKTPTKTKQQCPFDPPPKL